MQEIDCGTLYEVLGVFLPPRDRRVSAQVARQRALGFRHEGFEEMATGIGRLKNLPLLQPYRDDAAECCHRVFFEEQRGWDKYANSSSILLRVE